jgi:hypothetical protein
MQVAFWSASFKSLDWRVCHAHDADRSHRDRGHKNW